MLKEFKEIDRKKIRQGLAQEFENFPFKIIVLDDDPTGVQTVHDVSVYTDWDEASIRAGFEEQNKMFFILTNSRSFSAEKTKAVHQEIAGRIAKIAQEKNKKFIIISRGDSTLRGHYPLETEILKQAVENQTGKKIDFEVIAPFFPEGNRFTLNDIHYLRQDGNLIPVGETEFAKDKTFGYKSSNLREWIEEKTLGKSKASEVLSVSLSDTRGMNVHGIEKLLDSCSDFQKVVVNAIAYEDIEVFVLALIKVLKSGKSCIIRSAAALVKILGNIDDKPLLTRNELIDSNDKNGGIILVGSHVKKTTVQLEKLLSLKEVIPIEFNQHRVLEEGGLEDEVKKTTEKAESLISQGKTVAVYTKRKRIDFSSDSPEKNLEMAVAISEAVTSIIGNLNEKPSFIIAKGGITSSDVGTKALRVKKATVMGQIAPGIPVWKTGSESKFPNMPYIIFPGNVGTEETLLEVVRTLI